MCGINFISSLATDQSLNIENKKELDKMNTLLNHRGPDNQGIYLDNFHYLGHSRLSIVDLSVKANQPLVSSTKKTVVSFNGEIYNHLELREDLKKEGYKFRTSSDTEVINAIYEIRGNKGLDELEGMFVFVLYDVSDNLIIVRRDRYGIKPLYYTIHNKKLYGSSEILPLISITSNKNINKLALSSIFIFDNNCFDESIISGIYKLEPGFELRIKDFSLNKNKWFDFNKLSKDPTIKSKDVFEFSKYKIEEAIRRQSDTFVKTCVFFSGGIDSSLISFYSSQINSEIKLFSYFPDSINENNNDILNSSKRARLLGIENFEFLKFGKNDARNYLDKYIEKLYEPICDLAVIPTLFMSDLATNQGYKVVLTGDGADEIFGGYNRYKIASNNQILTYLSLIFGKKLDVFGDKIFQNKSRFINILKFSRSLQEQYNQLLTLEDISRFTGRENELINYKNDVFDKVLKMHRSKFDSSEITDGKSFFNELCNADLRNLLPNQYLPKIDSSTMLFSLEARVPFLDDELIKFAISNRRISPIPKISSKPILRNIISREFNREFGVIPKQGYGCPIKDWFKGPLKQYISPENINFKFFENNHIFISRPNYVNKYTNLIKRNSKLSQKDLNNFWKVMFISKWINKLKTI